MSKKSILEIQVVSAEFDRYKEQFDKYTEQLKKQPQLWKSIAGQHAQLAQQLQNTAEAADDEHKKLTDLDKLNEANEKRLAKSKSMWESISGSSESFAKNLISTGGFLSKWGSVIFGGVLGGAALGIDRAVHDAASTRQRSLGLGATPGQLRAFETDFGRIGDLTTALQDVNNMQTDYSARGPWYQMGRFGAGKMTGDTVSDTERYLDAQRRFAQQTIAQYGVGQLGLMARAMGINTPVEQLRLMASTPNAEWQKMQRQAAADASTMNTPGAAAMQDLETQFGRNWQTVATAFENQVSRAAPLLEKLGDAAANATGKLITHTGDAIAAWWAKAQTNPWGAYGDAVAMPFKAAWNVADYAAQLAKVDKWFPGVFNGVGALKDWAVPSFGSVTASPASYANYLARGDMVRGLPKGLLEAVWKTESGGNLFPPNSSAGAAGAFQFMPDTAKMFGINPYNPVDSANAAGDYFAKLTREFQDFEKTLAAYNWGPGHMETLLREHPNDWKRYLPKETADYIRKIEVILQNNTGGSATVAASQLAH